MIYPTWPMVFAALVAGALAGFIVPDRPQSDPAPVKKAAVATAPGNQEKKLAEATSVKSGTPEIREVPLTRPDTAQDVEPAKREQTDSAEKRSAAAPGSCAAETWPYRTPSCLDRSAAVAPAATIAKVKRVDPTVRLTAETGEQRPAPEETRQKAAAAQPAPQEKPRARTVSNAGDRPEDDQPASARPARPDEQPRQTVRRLRDLEFNDGIPTRVYLRGPDGRLYLAPEYRPGSQPRYYVR